MKVFFANLFEEAEILSELDMDIAAKLFIFLIRISNTPPLPALPDDDHFPYSSMVIGND